MKLTLTVLLTFGICLLLAWPWILGHQPPATHRVELARYTLRFGVYLCSLLIIFFTTAVLASVIARRARLELRDEALGNMKFLIETTLEEHRKKNETPDA